MSECWINGDEHRGIRPRRALGALYAQAITTACLVVALAVALTVVSLGIARADTLSATLGSDTARIAFAGFFFALAATGGLIAAVMWLTAPRGRKIPSRH